MSKITVLQLAKMIDHSLLHPTMTDTDLREGCAIAKAYNVASVCIKPYAIKDAVEWLAGSDVMVGTVIGFPHGNSAIKIKVAECKQSCLDGAVEIDMVVNIGKVLQEDWRYIRKEIAAVQKEATKHGATVKVIFENDYLPKDKYKRKLCEICSKVGVAFVKTSTGYGFVKGADGKYSYEGATEADLILMRKYSAAEVEVKAAGGVRSLDDLLRVREFGVTRVGATATIAMLEDAKKRFNEPNYGAKIEAPKGPTKGGY
jgi:deoxyribose-phosphate aldolase